MHPFGAHSENGLRCLKEPNRGPHRRDPKPPSPTGRCNDVHETMVFRNRRADLRNAAKRTNDAGSDLVFDERATDTATMVTQTKSLVFSLTLLFSGFGLFQISRPATALQFTSDGEMRLPENYRQWVYLTTGFDMSYNP